MKLKTEQELVNTAKLLDLESIKKNSKIYKIISFSKHLNEMVAAGDKPYTIEAAEFWSEMPSITDDCKSACSNIIRVYNLAKSGIVLSDGERTVIVQATNELVNYIVSYHERLLPILRPIRNSVIPSDVMILNTIDEVNYAKLVKMNSHIYANINKYIKLSKLFAENIKNIVPKLSSILTMMQMNIDFDVIPSSRIIARLDDINDNIKVFEQILSNRYTNANTVDRLYDTNVVSTDTGNAELFDAITKYHKLNEEVYSAFNTDLMMEIFNSKCRSADSQEDAYRLIMEIKGIIIDIKMSIDILIELICKSTDDINDSLAKIKESIPDEHKDGVDVELV